MSLTSSDGTGLILVSMTALGGRRSAGLYRAEAVFRNPEPRQIEGQFEITLPPGAAIRALRCVWRPLARRRSRRAFRPPAPPAKTSLHRQDPALLENRPVTSSGPACFHPAVGRKELILSYSEERPRADQPYRIYLRGLPKLSRLDIRTILAKSATRGRDLVAGRDGGDASERRSPEGRLPARCRL